MKRSLIKSISSDHTLLVYEVDYSREGELFTLLQKNNINLEPLKEIKNKERRVEWMTVRSSLLNYFEEPIEINYNEHNKPSLSQRSELISISHSYHRIALSISLNPNAANGVDIQVVNPKIIAIREKFLKPSELNLINPDNSEELGFCWSIKEALFKVYGKKDVYLKENMHIHRIDWGNQIAKTSITANHYQKSFSVRFELIDNYSLAYIVNS